MNVTGIPAVSWHDAGVKQEIEPSIGEVSNAYTGETP
jgi:hypothetical protein